MTNNGVSSIGRRGHHHGQLHFLRVPDGQIDTRKDNSTSCYAFAMAAPRDQQRRIDVRDAIGTALIVGVAWLLLMAVAYFVARGI
jgi:hypothetical protein